MNALCEFHRIAASRGEGLLPEFLELVARERTPTAITELDAYRPSACIQAGPHPTGDHTLASAVNLILFATEAAKRADAAALRAQVG